MSEKIYAYLLRLFPSAFRREYEEESIRLLDDRLRDERGFFRRLRLSFDLIVDVFGALPQAYRNSYAEVAPATLPSQFDGIPSFRGLELEPIQRGTIIIAGVLSLTTALAAFTFVMEPSTPYRSNAQNGRISPVESVLERLNGSISPNSAGSVHDDAPSALASEPRQIVQGQPEAARITQIANLSGSWTASVPARGGVTDIPREFIFWQDHAELSGTGRPDFSPQPSIIHGFVDGDSVRFEFNNGQRKFLYDLKVENTELVGSLSMRGENEMSTAKVRLQRVH